MPGRRLAVMIILAALVVGVLAFVASSSGDGGGDAADVSTPTGETGAATTQRPAIQETEEYIRSNEPCPPDLPTLDPVPVANFGIGLEHMIEQVDLTVMAFTGDGRGFIGDRTGHIWSFEGSSVSSEVVADLSDDTTAQDDQGLIGMATSPDGQWLYVNHTNRDGDSVVEAFPITDADLGVEDRVEILVVDQPSRQHNGGDLAFGPDGYLYVSFGDGGGLGDPRHHGQDLGTVLGAILRLDVEPTAVPPYQPAPGNPYLRDADRDPLIWAAGVRNPFRLSFDRVQGDLWVADVGQQCIEEINMLSMQDGGANLGWNVYEGSRRFIGDPLRDHHQPVFEYRHGRGLCAVVGGYVYRGPTFPELLGRYVFSDLCSGALFALNPGGTPELIELPLGTTRPVGFAQDPTGELYVIDIESGIHRITPAPIS